MVKNPPAMQETQARSLSQEDPLEKGMATHSSILAWRIPWTEEPGKLCSSWGRKELDMTEQPTHTHKVILAVEELSSHKGERLWGLKIMGLETAGLTRYWLSDPISTLE